MHYRMAEIKARLDEYANFCDIDIYLDNAPDDIAWLVERVEELETQIELFHLEGGA